MGYIVQENIYTHSIIVYQNLLDLRRLMEHMLEARGLLEVQIE